MKRLDDLPDLPTAAPYLLAALLGVGWLAVRIRILRRRRERGGPQPVPAWAWLGALADRAWILPVLGVLALLLAAGVVLSFVLAP
jgi:hypothetical protein